MRGYDEYVIVALWKTSSCAVIASMWWRGRRRVHGRSWLGNRSSRDEGAGAVETGSIATSEYVVIFPEDNAAVDAVASCYRS